jgi:glyoxylase-like metal-dependent hydrolase (beta-lactamase superfamily II)
MRMTRLPGIHHDANCVVVAGEGSSLVVDAGTSWYQQLQVERILGVLDDGLSPEHLLLTSRRFPFAGGAAYLVEQWPEVTTWVGSDGVSALETGDFFSTWANRYDSDMPPVRAQAIADGDVIALGDGGVQALALPGHAPEAMGYLVDDRSIAVVGGVLPRADLPARLDLPGASLLDHRSSLVRLRELHLEAVVPMRGPAIRGRAHVAEVLDRHIAHVVGMLDDEGRRPRGWPRPAPSALWMTPLSPWPLEEHESEKR